MFKSNRKSVTCVISDSKMLYRILFYYLYEYLCYSILYYATVSLQKTRLENPLTTEVTRYKIEKRL